MFAPNLSGQEKDLVGRIVVVVRGADGARADPYLCHTSAHHFAKAAHLPHWTSRRSVRPLVLAFPLILHKHTLYEKPKHVVL